MDIIIWPFAWLLLNFNKWFGNYGIAIILFAIVIKLITLPFQMKSKRGTMRSARLQPLVKDLEKKYGDDKQRYQEAVSKLYKDEKINPMSGCLWSVVPMAIMLMLYGVIREPLTTLMGIGAEAFEMVKVTIQRLSISIPTSGYPELQMINIISANPTAFEGISDKLITLDFSFLGMNLGKVPNWQVWAFDWSDPAKWGPALGLFLIPILSALLSYFSMKLSMASNPAAEAQQQQGMMKGMNAVMPLMSVYFCFIMPAALGVYWIVNSVLAMVQDFVLNRYYGKIVEAEDAERRARINAQEAELERKRQETERKRELGETERNKNTSKKKIQAVEKTKNEERIAKELAEEKAARRAALGLSNEAPASQVGTRRYAKGRAYVEDRFTNPEDAEEATKNAEALSDIDEAVEKEFDVQETSENSETAE